MSPSTGPKLIYMSVLMTVALFLLSKSDLTAVASQPFLTLGQLSGLLGAVLISISFLLTTRMSLLERLFGGLDRVYSVHHTVGGIAFVFLLEHPLMLAVQRLPHAGAAAQLFIPTAANIPYAAGILGLYGLTVLLIVTLFITLPYHIWKRTHEWLGLVLISATIHAALIPSDISRFFPLRAWVLGFAVAAIAAYLYTRFYYPYAGRKFRYRVASVTHRGDILDIVLAADGPRVPFRPGQFMFLGFRGLWGVREGHPFSISSAPEDTGLRFSVKIVGDHTLQLRSLTPGAEAVLQGPYGRFSENFSMPNSAVLVGGGVGITPLLSMARSHATVPVAGRQVHIVYSVSTREEAVYDAELRTLGTAVDYHLWVSGENGRLTADALFQMFPAQPGTRYFLCGPPAMMTAIRRQLTAAGVRQGRIFLEDFSIS